MLGFGPWVLGANALICTMLYQCMGICQLTLVPYRNGVYVAAHIIKDRLAWFSYSQKVIPDVFLDMQEFVIALSIRCVENILVMLKVSVFVRAPYFLS